MSVLTETSILVWVMQIGKDVKQWMSYIEASPKHIQCTTQKRMNTPSLLQDAVSPSYIPKCDGEGLWTGTSSSSSSSGSSRGRSETDEVDDILKELSAENRARLFTILKSENMTVNVD